MVKKEGTILLLRLKRGMSPLVATVLLIAFAVALGAMIMNWSDSVSALGSPDCSGISIIINPYVCYAQNLLRISVQNTGKNVEALTFRVVDVNNNEVEFKHNSRIVEGEIFSKEYPFQMTAKTKVEVIPSVSYQEKVTECDRPSLKIDNLESCSN